MNKQAFLDGYTAKQDLSAFDKEAVTIGDLLLVGSAGTGIVGGSMAATDKVRSKKLSGATKGTLSAAGGLGAASQILWLLDKYKSKPLIKTLSKHEVPSALAGTALAGYAGYRGIKALLNKITGNNE